MHLSLILCAVTVACCVRLLYLGSKASLQSKLTESNLNWSQHWQHTLGLFLFPPLLLLVMAGAVLHMGKEGRMLGIPVGEIGFSCALGFLGLAVGGLLWQWVQAWRSIQKLRQHSVIKVQNAQGYLLETNLPFAAQVGLWHPHLVISQGLLGHFSVQHVAAVLTHEQAHAYYRDTFWFFWLGWLRRLTAWLPNTEPLWQDLLLLREMRADRWAAERVDGLLLAEALLQMTQFPYMSLENSCAAMGSDTSLTRLEERIEALLASSKESTSTGCDSPHAATLQPLPWWLLLTLMPLTTVVLHH